MNKTVVVTYLALGVIGSSARATLIDFTLHQSGPHAHQLHLQRPSLVPEPYPMDLVTNGLLAGSFATIEPGWDGLGVDDAAGGRFALLSDTGVALERVSFPVGFSMLDSGLNPILENDGDHHVFSGAPEGPGLLWHEHLRFVGEPGLGMGHQYTASFRLVDINGLHAASDPFTLTFVTVPEPSSLLPIGSAMWFFARRRGSTLRHS